MKKITKKEKLSNASYVMRCENCNKIVASASEPELLPEFTTCDCEDNNGLCMASSRLKSQTL